MNNENISTLQQILNTLSQINTKGQDSIYMGTCLVTLNDMINRLNSETTEAADEAEDTEE